MKNWGLTAALLLLAMFALAETARAEVPISEDVRQMAQRVRESADHQRRPFAIVDKRAALLVVFHANGQLAGSAPALLGSAYGDDTAAGVGERTQRGTLRAGDATTPAGRFLTQPGHNHAGEAVIWVDLDAAFAIHRLRPGSGYNMRAQRLDSTSPRDNRVSAGCVVVAVAFFKNVVLPLLGRQPAVVYVLPEAGLAAAGGGPANGL